MMKHFTLEVYICTHPVGVNASRVSCMGAAKKDAGGCTWLSINHFSICEIRTSLKVLIIFLHTYFSSHTIACTFTMDFTSLPGMPSSCPHFLQSIIMVCVED